ncbi:sphingosine N-acyltransferase [Trifolium repens]|nr:sphingosine N-acyltransferase [Trifolium repens]
MLNMVVGMRGNMDTHPPTGYYGNTIVDANVILNVRQLSEKPLYETAQLLKDGIKTVCTNEFVQKYIDSALQTDHVEDLSIEAYGSHAKPSTCKNACNAFPGVHSHALKRKQFAEDSLTGKNYAFKDYLLTIFMRRS